MNCLDDELELGKISQVWVGFINLQRRDFQERARRARKGQRRARQGMVEKGRARPDKGKRITQRSHPQC